MDSRTLARHRDTLNRACNEQQKLVFLAYVKGYAIRTCSDLAELSYNRLMINFVHTELQLGLTFATIARNSANGSQTQSRNVANARKAFRTVVDWSKRLAPHTTLNSEELNTKLGKLRDALEQLGEKVGD